MKGDKYGPEQPVEAVLAMEMSRDWLDPETIMQGWELRGLGEHVVIQYKRLTSPG